jgi:hypothetical protein
LTATLAGRARRHSSDPAEARRFFEEAQAALRQARLQDPDSYYPVDILAWFTKDAIRSNVMERIPQADLVADTLASLQAAESMELDREQTVMLQSRRLELGGLIEWRELEEDAFRELEEAGSTAGYFLRALKMSGLPRSATNLNAANHEKIADALSFLQKQKAKVARDPRCLDLLLDLWWIEKTGHRLFAGERLVLPLTVENWHECLAILEDIQNAGEPQRPLTIAFLRGLALFHLDQIEASLQVFRELDRESERTMGRRRIVRSYLAGTPEGKPMKFHGIVSWVANDGNRGAVHVEELRRQIGFRPRDFGAPQIEQRATLGEFHIAFNFLGPIADPVTMFKQKD